MTNYLTRTGLFALVLTAILGTIYFVPAAKSAQNVTPTFSTSRFMLFSGTYQVSSGLKNSTPVMVSGVFKLDTYTGNTWILKAVTTAEHGIIEQWQPIHGLTK